MRIISISALPLWVMGDKKGLPSIYLGAKSFVEAGHEVHFITSFRHLWRNDLDEEFKKRRVIEEVYDGIHIYRFQMPFLPALRRLCFIPKPSSKALRLGKQLIGLAAFATIWFFFTVRSHRQALRVAREHKPDVVYAHNGIAALAAFALAKKYRIPNITRIYGTFLSQIPWQATHRLLQFPEVMGFKIPCTYLIIDNDGTQGNKVAERLHVPSERVRFWMNGVDKDIYDPRLTTAEAKERLGISPRLKVILALGRLESWKRVDRLIRAAPEIIAGYAEVLFVIVGDGNARKSLVDLSRELGIERSVRFEGAVPHANVSKYLHAADIFVSVQDVTNFGIHIMEAMICGRCVVTMNNGDTGTFVVNDHTGRVLEPDSIGLLPSAILAVLRDDELRKRLGEAARRYAHEHFETWKERMDKEVKLVEGLVPQRRSSTTPSRNPCR
jgi:glycosyltransferase involved in cell wall biosynthesis